MNPQVNPSPNTGASTGRNTKWLLFGSLIALVLLVGVAFTAYRSGQNSTSNSTPSLSPQTPNSATSGVSSTLANASYEEAARTWKQIEDARTEMNGALESEKLDQIHHSAFEIRDQVRKLPDVSPALPEQKRQELNAEVKQVDRIAEMLDVAGDANNVKSTHQHHRAMDEALVRIRSLYPEGVLPSHGPMHGMGDDKMPGPGMGGKGMGGKGMGGMMRDKMGPAGAMGDDKMDPGKAMGDDQMGGGMTDAPDPGKSGMGGGGMGAMMDDKMGGGMGMGMGMGMMDMMMSGMPAADQKPMKMMMDDMMAMPPAQRKQAMKKMKGMPMPGGMGGGKAAMTGDATMKKMTAGMSAADAAQMKMTMEQMMAMPAAERKKAMQKMTAPPMPGGMGGGAMKDDAGDM